MSNTNEDDWVFITLLANILEDNVYMSYFKNVILHNTTILKLKNPYRSGVNSFIAVDGFSLGKHYINIF